MDYRRKNTTLNNNVKVRANWNVVSCYIHFWSQIQGLQYQKIVWHSNGVKGHCLPPPNDQNVELLQCKPTNFNLRCFFEWEKCFHQQNKDYSWIVWIAENFTIYECTTLRHLQTIFNWSFRTLLGGSNYVFEVIINGWTTLYLANVIPFKVPLSSFCKNVHLSIEVPH